MHTKNNFDALRLLGASLVLISHEFPLSARVEPQVAGAITVGKLGLMLFFSISGYLITQSWIADPSLQRFAARRFLRIWPALAAFVVVSSIALVVATGRTASAVQMLGNLIPFRMLDSRAFPENPIHFTNGSLWSIPLEIACYAGFAAVAILSGAALRYVLGVMVLLAAAYGVLFGVAIETGRIPGGGPPYLPLLASFFFAGSALAYWRPTKAVVAVVFVLAAMSLLALHNAALALMLVVPVATVIIGNQSWALIRDAGKYGDFSYGLYLWAWPMQQLAIVFLGVETNVIALLAVSASAALACAFVSWCFIEAPAMRLKPRKPGSVVVVPEVVPAV